jgi:hypothetical protein
MDIQDLLFVETDDSCALCGFRGSYALTVHHIDGDHDNNAYDNRIVLCRNCHNAYHEGKQITKNQIETRKRHLIRKTLTQYGLNAMKIALRNNFGVVALPFLIYHVVDLGYMRPAEDTPIEEYKDQGSRVAVTALYAITETGRALLYKWFE